MDVLQFLQDLKIDLDPEDIQELQSVNVTEEEVKHAKEFLTDLGFDLQSFGTEGNHWIVRLFNKQSPDQEKIRAACVKIQSTFRSPSPFNNLIKLLYAIGFSLRDIVFTLYRLGFKGIPLRTVQNHIKENQFEFSRERLRFMELIDCTKASVFQELAEQVKATERKNAEIYLKSIEKIQEALDDVDPVIEQTKFNRLVGQIEKLQAMLHRMHGIDELRKVSVEAAGKIAVLKAVKDMERDVPQNDDGHVNGKMLDADMEVIHPFAAGNKSISQRLAS